MPKAKSKRPAKKAARSPAKRARPAAAKRTAAPKQAKRETATRGRIDPRVVAAIGLALQAEELAAARAAELSQELSPWTALGRVRAVRTR